MDYQVTINVLSSKIFYSDLFVSIETNYLIFATFFLVVQSGLSENVYRPLRSRVVPETLYARRAEIKKKKNHIVVKPISIIPLANAQNLKHIFTIDSNAIRADRFRTRRLSESMRFKIQ